MNERQGRCPSLQIGHSDGEQQYLDDIPSDEAGQEEQECIECHVAPTCRSASPPAPVIGDSSLRILFIQMLRLRDKKKGSVKRHTLCSRVFSYEKRDAKPMILNQKLRK